MDPALFALKAAHLCRILILKNFIFNPGDLQRKAVKHQGSEEQQGEFL